MTELCDLCDRAIEPEDMHEIESPEGWEGIACQECYDRIEAAGK